MPMLHIDCRGIYQYEMGMLHQQERRYVSSAICIIITVDYRFVWAGAHPRSTQEPQTNGIKIR